MNAQFHVIDKASWERSIYFDYYYSQIKCKYTLNANLDITHLRTEQKQRGLRFFPSMLYVIMRAVNQNKEFRMSFNEAGELGYWDEVVPSYTLFHPENKTGYVAGTGRQQRVSTKRFTGDDASQHPARIAVR